MNMRVINITQLLVVVCLSQAKLRGLVVEIDSGKVSGWESVSRDGRVYQAWTGIPYAAPPVAELRFKAPREAKKWAGILNATGASNACVQLPSGEQKGTEDCLYLSVYRPKISMENMPVIFHVHGGSFQNGNMGPLESADYLMDENVVLVRIQYRLGIFGFLSLGNKVIPGNFGLKDQVMALKWVQRNIAAFGGNPNSVTVRGESAGGKSAHVLLKSPACDGLVHRAFSDSGSINRFWSLLKYDDKVKNFTMRILESVDCLKRTSQEILNCMQKVDTEEILKAIPAGADPTITRFLPVIEPEDAEDAVATSDLSLRPSDKPWITSVCTGEWALFKHNMMYGGSQRPTKNVRHYLQDFFTNSPFDIPPNHVQKTLEVMGVSYFAVGNSSTSLLERAAKMQGDLHYIYPAVMNIMMHMGPKWIFRFEHDGEISRYLNSKVNITENAVYHATQVFYYFNERSKLPELSPNETPDDYKVSKRMIKYLVNFAYYNDPTPEPSPYKWKQFNGSELLRITDLGDYLADETTLKQLIDVAKLLNTVLGWI